MASKDVGSRKIQKAKVDRLSSLPDELLSHILSLLPTKCVVGTSILSNRWKFLWTSVNNFDLEGPSGWNISKIVDFTNFVDKVFRSCTSSHSQKFRLHVPWDDKTRVTAWINEAVRCNAREVDINVRQLPLSIFSCKTVCVLTLSLPYCDDANIVSFDLPCLKVLHLEWQIYCKGLLEKLIGSCPVLEDLSLAGCLSDENFMVSSPALRTLQLQPSNYYKSPVNLCVEAPTLEYLHLDKVYVKHNIKGDFSCLVKAYVNIDDLSYFQRRKGIPQFFALPKFHNLTCLEVVARDSRFWAVLPKLLTSSPSLEVLSLEQVKDRMPHDDHFWVEPKSIPRSFRFHLAVIKIKGFKGRKHELQLVKYVLGNAKVLQSLSISCQGLTQVKEKQFYGKLSKFPRASGSCRIQFHGDFISNL